jgi:RNA polymerase sigma-70 factor (ECF subfamily)
VGLPIRSAAAEPPEQNIQALIAAFGPDALRLARKLVRSQAEAEDLAQTAVTNVLARAHAISDPALVKPYLMTAVRNLWRNQLRAGRRVEPARDQEMFDRIAEPTPDEPPFSVLDTDTLRVALETLSVADAELIRLRYVERLDHATIGKRLGISPPTARQRVHRARERLRAACFQTGPETENRRVCHITRVRLARYARAALPRRVAARVTLHLRACDECRSCYSNLLQVLDVEPHPDVFPDAAPET